MVGGLEIVVVRGLQHYFAGSTSAVEHQREHLVVEKLLGEGLAAQQAHLFAHRQEHRNGGQLLARLQGARNALEDLRDARLVVGGQDGGAIAGYAPVCHLRVYAVAGLHAIHMGGKGYVPCGLAGQRGYDLRGIGAGGFLRGRIQLHRKARALQPLRAPRTHLGLVPRRALDGHHFQKRIYYPLLVHLRFPFTVERAPL